MKHKRIFFLGVLLVLPFLVYIPALKHELIWDSKPFILENDLLKGDFSVTAPFRSGYWATTSQRSDKGYDYYRPLTTLSFMMEKAAWGLSPFRLRLTNLLLFIAALFGLYFFLSRQAAPPGTAETAALLFALFPIHLDNINWVVGRCDLLMLLFGTLSLLLFDHFLEKKSVWSGTLAVGFFALALFSKEAALFFLPLFPLHELIRRRRLSPPIYVPFLLVTVVFWLLKSMAIGHGGFPIRPFPSIWENVQPVLGALGYYARSLVFPYIYDMFLPVNAVQAVPYLLAGAGTALFLVLVPLWGRKRSGLLGAWFWIAPFLGGALLLLFTPIHPFSISTRYLMIPAIGWVWLLGHGLASLRPAAKNVALAALLVICAASINVHSQKYRSEADFWKSAFASCPNDSFFMSKYAKELNKIGDFIQGEILLRHALSFPMKPSTAVSIALQLSDIAFAKAFYEESLDWLEKLGHLKLVPMLARHRLLRLLKIQLARSDLAGAETVITKMTLAFSATETTRKRIELYLAFAEWEKARAVASTLPAPQAAEWSEVIQKEENVFHSLDPGQQAAYFIRRGNFGSAWDRWPAKDAPGIPEQLHAARLAILAGHGEEGERRIRRLANEHEADFRILNSVGNLLFELQRTDEALIFYRRSLRVNPGQPALIERAEQIRLLERRPIAR